MKIKPSEPLQMPSNPDLEQRVIQACILPGYEEPRDLFLKELAENDFHATNHKYYFKAIKKVAAENIPPDPANVWEKIKKERWHRYALQKDLTYILRNSDLIINEALAVSELKDLSVRREEIKRLYAAIKQATIGKYSGVEVSEYILKELSKINLNSTDSEAYLDCIDMCAGGNLLKMEFPEIQWIIPDILTEGVTLFAGKPKAGKSVLSLNICVAVATGGICLGRNVQQGRVLYLHLEDNRRRLKKRIEAMVPIDDYTGERTSSLDTHLDLAVSWPRMGEGGLRALDLYCAENKPRLVVIDTFKAFQSGEAATKVAKQQYDIDYDEFIKLRPIAEKHNASILVVGHARKAHSDDPIDLISGTFGKAGAVDNCLVLTERKGNRAKLYTFGRDVDNEMYTIEYTKSTWTWSLLGKSDHVNLMESQQEVLSFLLQGSSVKEPATLAEISANTNVERSNLLNRILPKLIDNGLVKRPKKGFYYAV